MSAPFKLLLNICKYLLCLLHLNYNWTFLKLSVNQHRSMARLPTPDNEHSWSVQCEWSQDLSFYFHKNFSSKFYHNKIQLLTSDRVKRYTLDLFENKMCPSLTVVSIGASGQRYILGSPKISKLNLICQNFNFTGNLIHTDAGLHHPIGTEITNVWQICDFYDVIIQVF